MISAYATAEYPNIFGGAACMSAHWSMAGGAVLDWYRNHSPNAWRERLHIPLQFLLGVD